MTPQQRWKQAWQARRLMNTAGVSSLDKHTWRAIFAMLPISRELWNRTLDVRRLKYMPDRLNTQDKRQQQHRVKCLLSDLRSDPQVDLAYVRRKIGDGLRDIYHAW